MKDTIANMAMTMLAIASLSCLVSLMALFMGGRQGGSDLHGLMTLQAGVVPIAIGISAFGVYQFVSAQGWSAGSKALWGAIPQWLVFIFLMLNSLVLFGEVAFIIVMRATDEIISWREHVPLACMFACSFAYLILHARVNSYPGSPPAMSGRWM
jgi:hypothetical protein